MSRHTSIHEADEPGIRERWRALWDQSPQRSPFSSLEYVSAVAEMAELRLSFHFVPSGAADGAGAALTWRPRGLYREVVVPPFTPYSPLLLKSLPPESAVHDHTSELDTLLESIERNFHRSRLHFHPTLQDARTPVWRGWNVHPLYTYVATPVESPQSWSAGAARTLRSSGDDFELIEDGSAAVASVNLCIAAYGRRKRDLPLPEDRLLPLVQRLREAGAATSFGVRSSGMDEMEAAVTVLHDRRESYYWVAGSRPGPAMTVLIGKMLPVLASRGAERFDFMGANTPSIAEFKRRLGTRLETYYGMTFTSRPELKLAEAVRRMFH